MGKQLQAYELLASEMIVRGTDRSPRVTKPRRRRKTVRLQQARVYDDNECDNNDELMTAIDFDRCRIQPSNDRRLVLVLPSNVSISRVGRQGYQRRIVG